MQPCVMCGDPDAAERTKFLSQQLSPEISLLLKTGFLPVGFNVILIVRVAQAHITLITAIKQRKASISHC